MARYKDDFIKIALNEGYDFLFLVDSDLYLDPKTLVHLLSLDKDIVSEVVLDTLETRTDPPSPGMDD